MVTDLLSDLSVKLPKLVNVKKDANNARAKLTLLSFARTAFRQLNRANNQKLDELIETLSQMQLTSGESGMKNANNMNKYLEDLKLLLNLETEIQELIIDNNDKCFAFKNDLAQTYSSLNKCPSKFRPIGQSDFQIPQEIWNVIMGM